MRNLRSATSKAERLVSQGKLERAIKSYKEILSQHPKETTLLNALGDLYVRTGNGAAAAPLFRQAAESLSKNGFSKKAIAVLRKAHRQMPTDPEVVDSLAKFFLEEGLAGEAKSVLMALAKQNYLTGKSSQARKVYEKVLEIDPRHIPAWLELSELAASEGDTETEFEAYLAVGRELAASGRIKEAIKLLKQANEADPKHLEIAKLRADLHLRSGDADRARELFEQLREDYPENAELLAALGEVALESGNQDEAKRFSHEAENVDRENERVLLLGGRLAAGDGDTDKALAYYKPLAERISTESPDSLVIAALEALAASRPDHIPTLRKLDDIYTILGDKDRLTPDLIRLVEALENKEEYAEAIETAERLPDLEPGKAAHRDRLKNLYAKSQGTEMFGGPHSETPGAESAPADITIGERAEETQENPEIRRILLETDVFLRYGLPGKAKDRMSSGLAIFSSEPALHERLAEILREEGEGQASAESCYRAAELWEDRGRREKALELRRVASELSVTAEAEPAGPEVIVEELAPQALTPQQIRFRLLAEKIAEAKYYLDQRFLSSAHELLSTLRQRNLDHPEINSLWEQLRSQVSVELEAAEVGKEVDAFFDELTPEVSPPEPTSSVSDEEGELAGEFEDELYALHSAVEKRRDHLSKATRKVDAEGILTHMQADTSTSLSQEDMRIHSELGTAYLESGLTEEAIVEFQTVVDAPAFHQKACLQLGICFSKKGMGSTAIEWLQRSLTAGGDEKVMADTLHQLGLVYKARGMEQQLDITIEQLRSMVPDHPGLKELE